MLTPPAVLRRGLDWLDSRDPEHDALRRAARAAIVIPLAAAIGFGIGGDGQTPLFAIFGSVALIIVVDFPGNRRGRGAAYGGQAIISSVLITLGSWVAPMPWLAITLMFVLGTLVTFAGVLSAAIAASQRATLLTFVLPMSIPTAPVGERLLGWFIALAVCVPAALFLFPPRHHNQLRRRSARVCSALANRLEGVATTAEVTAAMDALRQSFLGSDFRPVGMTAGSRALVRVVDELEWLTARVNADTAGNLAVITKPAVRVLRASARLLRIARVVDRAAARAELSAALDDMHTVARGRYREDVVELLGEPDDAAAVAVGRQFLQRRAVAATVEITGRIIAAAAAADARPVLMQVLGRQIPETGAAERLLPEGAAVAAIPLGYLATRSVVVRNSLRTGLGLALAVTATHVFPVQHGFWVVLGAMSVLRSSALSTGTNVVRAVIGTAVGFVLGALLIMALGVDPPVLWTLLPFVAFGSAYIPGVVSFAAGQAAFTMMVLIIFNLIIPSGWRVGLIRIEDVVVGCTVGVVTSLLLWPGGATGSVSCAIDTARVVGSRYLRAAVQRVTRGTSAAIDAEVSELSHDMLTAARTVDDGVRHYLSESGGATDARAPVVRAASRTIRLGAAADLIADVPRPPPQTAYPRARAVLEEHANAVCERLAGPADPGVASAPISDAFVVALRAESTGDEAGIDFALPLVTVAASIGELEVLYPELARAPTKVAPKQSM